MGEQPGNSQRCHNISGKDVSFLSFVNRRRERKERESKAVRYNTLGTSLVPYTVSKAFKQWSENWVVECKSPLKTANSSWSEDQSWTNRNRRPSCLKPVHTLLLFLELPSLGGPLHSISYSRTPEKGKGGDLEPCFCLLLLTILVAILSMCFLDTWFSNL